MTAAAADTQVIHTALNRLYTDAAARGWQPDTGRSARPDCWHDEAGTSEFTIKPPALGITVVSAHTPTDSLRLHIGGDLAEHGMVQILRLFLGWPESDQP